MRGGVPRATPGTAGPLLGVHGSVLLCAVHESDPLGLLASSGEVQDLHTALQLRGLFVTTAATVMRAIELLRRDVAPRIFDVVVIVATPRTLDGALNLIYEVNALPPEGTNCGGAGTPRRFAAFMCAEGMLFEASSSRLREAGAFIVGRLPAAPSTLRAIADIISTDVERAFTSAPPSPAGLGSDALAGSASLHDSTEIAPGPSRQRRGSRDTLLAGRHTRHRSDITPTGTSSAPLSEDGVDRETFRSHSVERRPSPFDAGYQTIPELASLTVAGALQVRNACDSEIFIVLRGYGTAFLLWFAGICRRRRWNALLQYVSEIEASPHLCALTLFCNLFSALQWLGRPYSVGRV